MFKGKDGMFHKDCRSVVLTTDASSTGFGGHSEDDYFWGLWGDHGEACVHQARAPLEPIYKDNINVGELWPILAALHRCCSIWRNCVIDVVTDNTQVYHEICTGRGTNPTTMGCLREIFWTTALYNIYLRPSWIRSEDNLLVDCLSRLKNPDSVIVCCDLIENFNVCCRFRLAEKGLGPDTCLVLGRHHPKD